MKKFCIKENIVLYIFSINTAVDLRDKQTITNGKYTETEKSSFWWNVHHWLHWKLSKWQLPVQPVMKISSKWRHFCFSVCCPITSAWMQNMKQHRHRGVSPKYRYHQISNISVTKSQNLNVSHLVLQLPFPNLLKPGVKSRMSMLQLHLSDQKIYCLLRWLILEVWRYFEIDIKELLWNHLFFV